MWVNSCTSATLFKFVWKCRKAINDVLFTCRYAIKKNLVHVLVMAMTLTIVGNDFTVTCEKWIFKRKWENQ